MVSTSTGERYSASDLQTLLRQMLPDIGENQLHVTDTVQKVVSGLRGYENVELYVVGPTAHTSLVQDALQKAGKTVTVFRQAGVPAKDQDTREGSGLVAIVGMSGRFPGGESLQEFWDLLLQGRDTHEKVGVPHSRS